MNHSIHDVLKPKDCVLCFGIPVNEAELDRAVVDVRKDFFHMFESVIKYRTEVIEPYLHVKEYLEAYGLRIHTDISLEDFRAKFHDKTNKVIILFSHWSNNSIEFKEGLIPFERVSDCIPHNYPGILDLCVCHPTAWIESLEKTHPALIKRYLSNAEETESENEPRGATPAIWLHFYRLVMKYLLDEELTYFDAITKAALLLLDKFSNKS